MCIPKFTFKVYFSTSQISLQQLINEPTNLTASSPSCIDLIFTSCPNLVMECDVHSSLQPNFDHQILFAKFDLNFVIRHILRTWNVALWKGECWPYSYINDIDVDYKVHLFNKTIKNILCSFILHETVTCDDRDPPWINSKIKDLIQEKNIS